MALIHFPVKRQVCLILVILLLNLQSFKSNHDVCVKLDGEETCYSAKTDKYRLYGTKTAYKTIYENNSSELNIGECIPKVFYLLCRHATRYPDTEHIEDMIKVLPVLKDKINNASLSHKVKMCTEDLKILHNWSDELKPEFGNKMTTIGVQETMDLARRFQARFPTLLNQSYSAEKFVFEFTSRERTKNTAEAFAYALFDEDSKKINFSGGINNDVLQFHKSCKSLREKCPDTSYDTSEIDKFKEGPLIQKVIESVSSRVGFLLKYKEIKLIYTACAFGYVLETGDIWCSLFSSDELKVLEFGVDIDDYYKDAYGNKINYEQACPLVQYIMNIFESSIKSSESKAVLQFSHAGGVKKVFSRFDLFQDDNPLKADGFCSQQDRKWRSSLVAPFLTNLALVLYDCGTENKVAAFHNEKPVKLGGCETELCSYADFFGKYKPISENCDVKSICSTCGVV